MFDTYLPRSINSGPWVAAYTLYELRCRGDSEFILPIGSMDTPYSEFAALGEMVLPPLFHEALTDELKQQVVKRILDCFPTYLGDNTSRIRVVELPERSLPKTNDNRILAFSVDTAIEEHGPHLPLATDTIQSYSVLMDLASKFESIEICKPLEYGQMTWGLPFGFSIDITAELLAKYVSGYARALKAWKSPRALYVVDVHGSITHRSAIVRGMEESGIANWSFRWLHEPLAEFASARGDQHAGGVETALVSRVSENLLDPDWWPARIDDIVAGQMTLEKAVELTPDLDAFCKYVRDNNCCGVVGNVQNLFTLDAGEMFSRMVQLATMDIERLSSGETTDSAGSDLW